jgi:hypothetical protein
MNPPRLSSAPRILRTFDDHGAYVRAYGDHYFLCAADLNHYLASGKPWDDPEAQRRAIVFLVAEVEAERSASTSAGSLRFADADHYVEHRRRLANTMRICRSISKANASALRLKEQLVAIISARP